MLTRFKIGDKVIAKDSNGDIHHGVICKIKSQALGWDENGNKLDKLKYHLSGIDGIRFNEEDLKNDR